MILSNWAVLEYNNALNTDKTTQAWFCWLADSLYSQQVN